MSDRESREVEGLRKPPTATLGQRLWKRFCVFMAHLFYRRFEVSGVDRLPTDGPVILCANHVNALVDALVVQASCVRPIHPLARSGLFRTPWLVPILKMIQAVPVYRRQRLADGSLAPASGSNADSFRRCYEYLGDNRVILIFPEGQSHSDPRLRTLRTGAARLALGSQDANGRLPTLVPVGLTFTQKGRFRANVLVQYGEPIAFEDIPGEAEDVTVRRLTDAIGEGLEEVTLNTDSWEDLALMKLLQEFFTLRSSRPTLCERFRSFEQLIAVHRRLRFDEPGKVANLREKLRRFAELCRRYGVRSYQLDLRYSPGVVARFVLHALAFLVCVFPLALWGMIHSALPYAATRLASHLTARGRDQYDTAGMVFGLVFGLGFWTLQTFAVHRGFGIDAAMAYAVSLPITFAIALAVARERRRILENVRVFLLFARKSELRDYLRLKRQELEIEVARLARIARNLSPRSSDPHLSKSHIDL